MNKPKTKKAHDVMARIAYKLFDLPYPYDDLELASGKIAKTRSTRRSSNSMRKVRPSVLAKIMCKVAGIPDSYNE